MRFVYSLVLSVFLLYSISAYEVGIDYHAYGANFTFIAFLTQYHIPSVRSTVLTQLQGIADRRASFVTLDIWFGSDPGAPRQDWLATFPISEQEKQNLHQYAEDVASIVSKVDGHRLRLNVALFWLAVADYQQGNLTVGFGPDHLNASEFTSRVETTTDAILSVLSNVRRPDGVLVVERVYLDYEVMIGAKPNQDWFLITHYPRFITAVTAAGFIPTIYFLIDGREFVILEADYIDPEFPVLNGHRCMYWVYRSLYFLKTHQLPFPSRIDFSCYIDRNTSTYAHLVNHVFNDADATLSTLGAPKFYGVAETHYFPDDTQRREYGQAFAAEATTSSRLNHLRFWTTPDAGGRGVHIGYPFAVEDYLPPTSFSFE